MDWSGDGTVSAAEDQGLIVKLGNYLQRLFISQGSENEVLSTSHKLLNKLFSIGLRVRHVLTATKSPPKLDENLPSLSNLTKNDQADKLWSQLKSKYEMADLIHMPGVMHFLHKCTNGMCFFFFIWPFVGVSKFTVIKK